MRKQKKNWETKRKRKKRENDGKTGELQLRKTSCHHMTSDAERDVLKTTGE